MKKSLYIIAILSASIAYSEQIKGFVPTYTPPIDPSDYLFDETSFSKCILEIASKNQKITNEILTACKTLAQPKACRGKVSDEYKSCYEKCQKSNFITKQFNGC